MSGICPESKNGKSERKRKLPSWTSTKENVAEDSEQKIVNNDASHKERKDKRLVANSNAKSGHVKKAIRSEDKRSILLRNESKLNSSISPFRALQQKKKNQAAKGNVVATNPSHDRDTLSGSTLLVCNALILFVPFANTPKFKQVKNGGGIIISKEWVAKCYKHKKLVGIDHFFMHVEKLWRKKESSNGSNLEGNRINGIATQDKEKSGKCDTASRLVAGRGKGNGIRMRLSWQSIDGVLNERVCKKIDKNVQQEIINLV
eukprot:Gb_20031 [translate_table: standard]